MSLSVKWFQQKDLSGHWSRSIRAIPEKFSLESIRQYLMESRDKTFDKDSVRAFKSLKAYKYFQAGYVQKISTCTAKDLSVSDDDLFLAKAEVLPSMERKVYKVNVCLSSCGDVLGGSCMCVAGLGAACSHLAALLFALEDFIAQGFHNIPDDKACTDRLKQWNIPAKRHVEHTTISNIAPASIKKPRLAVPRADFRHENDRTVDEIALKNLHQEIRNLVPNSGFSKYGLKRNTQSSLGETDTELSYITVNPPSMEDIKLASDGFINSLNVTDEEISNIETLTRDQSKSKVWHKERAVRITASIFHQVCSRRESTDPSRLISQILGYRNVSTRAMKFGLKWRNRHSQDMPFLGASPDGIVKDLNGYPVKLVEFKNPSSTWRMSLKEAAMKLSCLRLDENDKIILNVKDKYYTQIQGQMGVCGINLCDFVLCTSEGIFVETVSFEKELWSKMKEKLSAFYKKFVAPEIVYPTVKLGYPALIL
ncbi:hypothetical protein KUTeg_006558 [Tegillarca granosa]|uniref:SWIM-type domain-containing protein n=1 Tax=Tegillarca granosa TaxID=220873 RepID=A0ABQ9FIW9_TEGGR|nr:hypothetical protein KUTeg_006558 [Tegillarca granosa]